MRIDKLELTNFRCFERWERSFSPRMNVLIGRNGTGKTAILEALVVAVRPYLKALRAVDAGESHLSDVRLAPFFKGGDLTLERQYPLRVACQGTMDERPWKVLRVFEAMQLPQGIAGEVGGGDAADLYAHAGRLAEAVSKGEDVNLPLIAYFGTDRLWKPFRAPGPAEPLGPGSRLRGYTDCLQPDSTLLMLEGWFKRMELIKLQDGAAPPMLDAAREAIGACLEEWDEVRYDFRQDRLLARAADGSRALPFHMLSDGVRNMIGMVGEIAYRAALLNPHLGAEAARKTPGVVLIDELDLHLHPSWQRRVVDDLRRTFPEVQFFGTTHSPIIVQSLLPGELIDLSHGQPSDAEHRSVEDILEGEMGLADVQRSRRWHEMRKAAEEYYRVLRHANGAGPEEKVRLKARLDELSKPFGDNPAYIALLEAKREAAGLGDSAA